jgi:hypothetical protein
MVLKSLKTLKKFCHEGNKANKFKENQEKCECITDWEDDFKIK